MTAAVGVEPDPVVGSWLADIERAAVDLDYDDPEATAPDFPPCPTPAYCPAAGDGPTDGGRAAAVARLVLGVRLMPWQRLVLDRALERDPSTGQYRHRTVVVTVPRQNGKSVLLQALIAERLTRPGMTVGMTSQSLRAAASVLYDPLAARFAFMPDELRPRVIRSQGNAHIDLDGIGSSAHCLSPSEKSGHGYSFDLVVVDEAWSHYDLRLAQSVRPTQIARPDPQLWLASTAGVAASVWLRQMVDAGEAGDVAYFNWTSPLDHDPADPASWAEANPAYGVTITEAALRDAHGVMSESEFARAHLNRWTVGAEAAAIPLSIWLECHSPTVTVAPSGMAFGFDVSTDRKWAAIAAASRADDGRLVVELVAHRAGTDWLLPKLAEMRDRHRPSTIIGNYAGPARALIDAAAPAGLLVEGLGTGDYVSACQTLYDAVMARRVAHRGQDAIDQAIRDSTRRKLAGSWAWAGGLPTADISPLVAVTLAASAAANPPPVPQVLFG